MISPFVARYTLNGRKLLSFLTYASFLHRAGTKTRKYFFVFYFRNISFVTNNYYLNIR